MPQDISKDKLLDSPQDSESDQSWRAAALPEPFQVDSYADRLMDDLFDDVERLLEGAVPPSEPVRVEAPPKPKLDIIPPAFSPGLLSTPNLPKWKPEDNLTLPELGELARSKPPEPTRSTFDRLLVFAGCTSLVAALAVWLTTQGIVNRVLSAFTPTPTVAPTTVAQAPQAVNADQQFAEYVQRSLEAIDRKAATGKPVEGLPIAPYKSNLPTVPVLGNQPPLRAPNNSSKIPVVINIPQAPLPAAPAADASRNRELNQILGRLASVLERLYPTANRPVTVQPAPVAVPPSPTAIAPKRTMVGILEGSDSSRSAVLFEMNGVTQRYYIGESIGSSGWSLVEVSKQYATIRRNGEVRTLSVGQKL